MDTTTLILWIIAGLIAGWSAVEMAPRRGFGPAGNIVTGILGAVLGGWLFSLLGITQNAMIGSIISAFLGSVILLTLVTALRARPDPE